ncbi:MAG: Gfo/Idh/MocA family oxidoreductase [Clostridia bacterium]|nr:Gfo/Idh/MocA family oxidoreductase [Clostridia bacterium]
MEDAPITAVIVGGGHRSIIYADYALKHPEQLKIVGIADPNPERRAMAAARYGFSADMCFENAETLARLPKLADAVINGTMDHQHYATAVPLLERGYDMLLEKPFAVNKEEMDALYDVIRRHGNKVMVCHVLRYAPFYLAVKKVLLTGAIGDILNIQTVEHVSYHHLSTSYVRGKWANSDKCKTTMLLAKSCHDIDIMMWMMQPTRPQAVSSFGSRFQFRPENAPEGAGTRCTVDCPYVDTCRYSSKRLYMDFPERWKCYVWEDLEHIQNPSDSDREKSFANGNPYDRCIYKCDNNVVDHQSVLVRFENGATGTHNMVGGSAVSMRRIHIIGTKGEIDGVFDEDFFKVRLIDPASPTGYTEETVRMEGDLEEGHGGGDDALTEDFVRYLATGKQSVSCTAIENSIAGHLTVFMADASMAQGGAPQTMDLSRYV